jgi:hypothetical protein
MKLLGKQVVKKTFELDAARPDAELGITALWNGLEVTALDGTTMELARSDPLACEFGSSSEAAAGRCCGSPRTSGPPAGGGSPQRPAATTTGRTAWPTSWNGPSALAC